MMEIAKEKNHYKKRLRKNIFILILLLVLLVLLSWISISKGASSANYKTVIEVLGNRFFNIGEVSETSKVVVLDIRIPRVCAAIFAGIALSNAGLLMQGIFQNPLVSPYTLGISNGASFGAAIAIVMGLQFTFLGVYAIPLSAFIFSIITMILVYSISKIAKESTKNLVLCGVAVGYLFSSLVSLMKYISGSKDLPEIVFWTMGSLTNIKKEGIALIMISSVVSLALIIANGWKFNVISYGRDTSLSLGVNYNSISRMGIVISTLMTGVTVAFTGIIGFVGLVSPHITRRIVGNDYRILAPTSSLVGALLLLASDTIARTIIAPVELPIGVITSIVGVPFFLYLIIKKR